MLSGHWSCGNFVEPFHLRVPAAVTDEAKDPGQGDRVIDALVLDVGLADDVRAGAGFGIEVALHGGEGHRLVAGDHLALNVAGGEGHDDRGQREGRDADLEEEAAVSTCLFERT